MPERVGSDEEDEGGLSINDLKHLVAVRTISCAAAARGGLDRARIVAEKSGEQMESSRMLV